MQNDAFSAGLLVQWHAEQIVFPEVLFKLDHWYFIFCSTVSVDHVQGECFWPPEDDIATIITSAPIPDPEPWHAPRCVVVTSEDVFKVNTARLWLDSLYLQV